MMRSVVILASMPRALVNGEGGHRPSDSKMPTYLSSALHCSGEQKTKKITGSGQNDVTKGEKH